MLTIPLQMKSNENIRTVLTSNHSFMSIHILFPSSHCDRIFSTNSARGGHLQEDRLFKTEKNRVQLLRYCFTEISIVMIYWKIRRHLMNPAQKLTLLTEIGLAFRKKCLHSSKVWETARSMFSQTSLKIYVHCTSLMSRRRSLYLIA